MPWSSGVPRGNSAEPATAHSAMMEKTFMCDLETKVLDRGAGEVESPAE
jgi:hypothetical protein